MKSEQTGNFGSPEVDALAQQYTERFIQEPALKELFSIYLTSSWRDLKRFIKAYQIAAAGGGTAELEAEAANVVDIAAFFVPATEPAFDKPMGVLRELYGRLRDVLPGDVPADALDKAYTRALAERAEYLQRYFQLKPRIAMLLQELGAHDTHTDLAAFAARVQNECCDALLDLLGANRALVFYRKAKVFDLSNSTFDANGRLCAIAAMFMREPENSGQAMSAHDREILARELSFLKKDASLPTRGIHAVPELAAVLECCYPTIMLADAEHYEMVIEHASKHFPPMLLLLEYVFSVVYYRKYILEASLPSTAELQNMPLGEYYVDPDWQFFNGGFNDYMARITIPICINGHVFAFVSVDSFKQPLGKLQLDDRARDTLREYEIYRRHRKVGQVQHLPAWLREHEPELVRDILSAVPDAIKNEDDFLRHRASDFMDSECSRKFYGYLRETYAVAFNPSSDDIAHLISKFKSPSPVSRQLASFTELLSRDIATALAALNALAATETKAHRAALIHVNKERNLTSRTLRHEGINKLTAMRNSIFDLNDYMLSLDQAWLHYIQEFGAFSEQHIDNSLYEQLGKAVKPLYSLVEERQKAMQSIQRCNNIGRDLNDLLLRYKGAEFSKGNEVIHALIDEVLDMYSELYFVGSRIEVIREYCDPSLTVFCYRDLLITVICGYLDNAYEALLKTEGGQRTIEITTTIERDMFHFTLADSGCGFHGNARIAADPMLLYSGYTSKDGEGHGVGLTIVKEIIEDVEFHNGRLDTPTSKPGRTTFGFQIPLEQTRAVQLRGLELD